MARSTRLMILIKNIFTLWGRKRFLLPVTYFPTNLVYPFTLRVTGMLFDESSIPFYSTSNGYNSDESSIPFYSTSNGYNNQEKRYIRVAWTIRYPLLSYMEICKQQTRLKCATYRRYTDLSVMGVRVGVANFFLDQSIGLTRPIHFS